MSKGRSKELPRVGDLFSLSKMSQTFGKDDVGWSIRLVSNIH